MSDASPRRVRNAERSRGAILDAAEALFAEGGYDATSLQAIGARAGVSRGTPGYFFGSKEALFDAVLERLLGEETDFFSEAQERAPSDDASGDVAQALDTAIASFLDFLAARPAFVRLLDREALTGGAILTSSSAHAASIREGLAIATAVVVAPRTRSIDPAAFLLSVLALCWFPFSHADTYASGLGVDPRVPADRDRWRRHIVDLVLNGIQEK